MRWRLRAPQSDPVVTVDHGLYPEQLAEVMDRCREAAFENSDLVLFFDGYGNIRYGEPIVLRYSWRTHSIERI